MRSLKVRLIVTLVLLGAMAALSATALYPTRMNRGSVKAALLPMALDSWTGQEIAVTEATKQILETDDVVQRNFTSAQWGNVPVQLAVVFSPDNRRVAHPPEVCYRGSGWEVTEKAIIEPEGLPPMVRMMMSSGSKRDLVMYCYKAGPSITADYYRQQVNIIVNQLMMRATSSALIRFSTIVRDNESLDEAQRRVIDLARKMIPEIQKTLTD